jgi:plasmid stabilization system protein ParE
MPSVELSRRAVDNLQRLITTHSLPPDTRQRVRTVLQPLMSFPNLGRELEGRWADHRVILGPWRWMLLVYRVDPKGDRVVVVTARTSAGSTRIRSERIEADGSAAEPHPSRPTTITRTPTDLVCRTVLPTSCACALDAPQ